MFGKKMKHLATLAGGHAAAPDDCFAPRSVMITFPSIGIGSEQFGPITLICISRK
jgi:hypothetical protein